MTWNSGSCDTPPGVGAAYYSEDCGMVRIPDADCEADERDRLFDLAADEPARHLTIVRLDADSGGDVE